MVRCAPPLRALVWPCRRRIRVTARAIPAARRARRRVAKNCALGHARRARHAQSHTALFATPQLFFVAALGFQLRAPPSGAASHARASPAAMKTLPELPSAVTGVLADAELADPNGFSEEDENVFLATVAVGAGGLFLLPIFPGILADVVCSTLIGGGAAAYCALRKDEIGDGARTVGSTTLQAVDKVKELDEEYKVLDKAKKLIDDAIEGGKKLLEGGD
jgi:hypothetical protein